MDLEDSYPYDIFPNMIKNENAFTRLDPILMDWNYYKNAMGNAKIYNPDISPAQFESYTDSTSKYKKYFGVNGYAYSFNKYTEALVDDLEFMRINDTIFHGQFIAGFTFEDASIGDVIRFTRTTLHDVGEEQGYSDYIIPDLSPFNLDNLAETLNESAHAAIKLFTYTVTNNKIYGRAKEFGNDTYHIVDFIDNSIFSLASPSEGLIAGDMFTFNYPYWLFNEIDLNELTLDYTEFELNSMFLFAPIIDKLNGSTNIADYWVDKHYIEIKDDEQIGHLPSIYGDNFLTLGNVKVFDSSFTIPKFAYVIFTINNIVGKGNFVWKIYKTGEDLPFFIVKDVPFLMWIFSEIGNFDIHVTFTDKNSNISETKIDNFVKVINADEYKKYAKDWLITRAYK